MPIKKAAIKALRQSRRRALKNLQVKKNVKKLVKESRQLIGLKEKTAVDKVKAAIKSIDKAAQKKILKKNTASRKKSRLMKSLNKMLK